MTDDINDMINKSAQIRINAKNLLKKIGLVGSLEKYGDVVFTGSFELDTMTWNDIDLQLVTNQDSKRVLADLSCDIINKLSIKKLHYIDFYTSKKPKMPKGRYLGLEYWDNENQEDWKFDIWILEQSDFDKNKIFMDKVKNHLTKDLKELVIILKSKLVKKYGRPPKLASYYIYKAIIEENLTTIDHIMSYLNKNEIHIEL